MRTNAAGSLIFFINVPDEFQESRRFLCFCRHEVMESWFPGGLTVKNIDGWFWIDITDPANDLHILGLYQARTKQNTFSIEIVTAISPSKSALNPPYHFRTRSHDPTTSKLRLRIEYCFQSSITPIIPSSFPPRYVLPSAGYHRYYVPHTAVAVSHGSNGRSALHPPIVLPPSYAPEPELPIGIAPNK